MNTLEKLKKDILCNHPEIKMFAYPFPTGLNNTVSLSEVLEPGVHEKYYLSEEQTKKLLSQIPSERGGKGSLSKKHSWDLIQINQPKHSNDRVYSDEGISPTLNSMQGGNRQPFITVPVLTPDRINKRQNGRRFKKDGEPSFTLNTQDKHGVYNGECIRRLTPTECERLQGFPDGWTTKGINENGDEIFISDSQKYKMMGNAVCVPVVVAIVKTHLIYDRNDT